MTWYGADLEGSATGEASASAATPKSDRLKVFISYSRSDQAFADELDQGLAYSGFETLLDRHSIVEGEDWQKRLGALIADADTVVFVLSPASARSKVCAWEVEEAHQLSKRILPVLWQPTGAIPAPPRLAALNYVRFDALEDGEPRSFMAGLKALVRALNSDVDWLREHTRLLGRAREWDAAGRPDNRLLIGREAIDAAKSWAARRPKEAPEPTALHLDFIRRSEEEEAEQQSERRRQLEERERLLRENEAAQKREAEAQREREAAQREAAELARKEAEQAKQLAEQQKAMAEQARRVTRRTRIGLVAALLMAAVAGGAGWWAWTQQQVAVAARGAAERQTEVAEQRKRETEELREQTQITESGLLAQAAANAVDRDPETAMLLTLEGMSDTAAGTERPWVSKTSVQLHQAYHRIPKTLRIMRFDGSVISAAISPDLRLIAAIPSHGIVNTGKARLLDAQTGVELGSFGSEGANGVAFSVDSRLLLVVEGNESHVFDIVTTQEIELSSEEFERRFSASTVDTAFLRPGLAPEAAPTWRSGVRMGLQSIPKFLTAIAVSQNQMLTAFSTEDNEFRINNIYTNTTIYKESSDSSIIALRFSLDNKYLAMGSSSGMIRLLDMSNMKEEVRIVGGVEVNAIDFSPDGNLVAVATGNALGDEGAVTLYDARTGYECARMGLTGPAWAVSFSTDGGQLVSGSGRYNSTFGELHLLDVHDDSEAIVRGAAARRMENNSEKVVYKNREAVFRGGNCADANTDDKSANGTATGRSRSIAVVKSTFDKYIDEISIVDMKTSRKLFSMVSKGKVGINKLSSTEKYLIFESKPTFIQLLASGEKIDKPDDYYNNVTKVINIDTGEEAFELVTVDALTAIATSADDRFLAVGTGDPFRMGDQILKNFNREVRVEGAAISLFDIAMKQEVARFTCEIKISSIWFSRDGKRISVECENAVSRSYPVFPTPQSIVDAAKAKATRCLTQAQRKQYFLPAAPPLWCIERRLWPYHTDAWQDWLPKQKAWIAANRAGDAPALPVE